MIRPHSCRRLVRQPPPARKTIGAQPIAGAEVRLDFLYVAERAKRGAVLLPLRVASKRVTIAC
jgi:hypothetical protein